MIYLWMLLENLIAKRICIALVEQVNIKNLVKLQEEMISKVVINVAIS